MNLLQLAWSYLRARPLGTLLNVLLLALGVGTIGFVLIVDGQIGDSLNRDAQGIDLVVGAKGSPDPADARRDLSPRRADRQYPAQVRAGARQESADPARGSAFHRRHLPRLLDRGHDARLHRPLPRHVRVRASLERQDAGGLRRYRRGSHRAWRRRPVRRLARPGRRRTGARRFGLYGGRRPEADRHGARPACARQSGKRLVRARGQHHRSRRAKGDRGRTAGHRPPRCSTRHRSPQCPCRARSMPRPTCRRHRQPTRPRGCSG